MHLRLRCAHKEMHSHTVYISDAISKAKTDIRKDNTHQILEKIMHIVSLPNTCITVMHCVLVEWKLLNGSIATWSQGVPRAPPMLCALAALSPDGGHEDGLFSGDGFRSMILRCHFQSTSPKSLEGSQHLQEKM